MATWKDPKTTHTAADQVTPDIFNTLAENENYLNEVKIETHQVQDGEVTSSQATTRANLASGDTVKVAFGKLRKWFADFGTLAFLNQVDTDQIAASAVTMGKIASHAVSTGKIDGLAVTTAKIADGAVTAVKLADGAVTNAKLSAGAVTDAKVSDVAASKITGLAAVATSGSYSDLTNKPSISSFKLERGTYTINKQYNIPATGLYLPFLKFTNNAGYVSVACLGTFNNTVGQLNPSYSSISSIYFSGQKQIQLRCVYISSTALRYEVYISSNATTTPSTIWSDYSDEGTLDLIMYKINNLSAIY